jgi:hypothetical protein
MIRGGHFDNRELDEVFKISLAGVILRILDHGRQRCIRDGSHVSDPEDWFPTQPN